MASNKAMVPEAKEALERFKMEAANEVGVNLKQGYNGDLTSRQAGYSNYEILVLLENPKKNKIILNFIKEHRQIPIKVVYCNSACNKFVTNNKRETYEN